MESRLANLGEDEVRIVFEHEIGHYLGLGHTTNPPTIMNQPDSGTCTDAVIPVTTISAADASQALTCITTVNSTASPTPTPSPTPQPCPGHCRTSVVAINQTCFGRADFCTYPQNDGCENGLYNINGCCCAAETPVLIDVLGNGFTLTNPQNGVNFDMNIDGTAERLSWTTPTSDDAWLVLDRNANGVIDNGSELFGNHTLQPEPTDGNGRNGFLALAEFDKSSLGGNGDGVISEGDAVANDLKLWQDTNHNGVSELFELHSLEELGLKEIELKYKRSNQSDSNGNFFRYRAKIKDNHDAQMGRWAWDVVLAMGQ